MEPKIEVKKEKKYKNYDQNSLVHLPVLLSDLVKDNVLVHLVNELVEEIEMDSLNEYYADGGRPPYHPKMMIKVWIYGYCSKVYTSRNLAKKLREDLGFMWLSGMQQPCFKTLSDFRGNRMKDMIEVVFKEVLCYLVLNNYIDLDDLYIDGSKWEANIKNQCLFG